MTALARGQSAVFEASAARETERLDTQLDAAPKLSLRVYGAAMYAAAWSLLALLIAIVELSTQAHHGHRQWRAASAVRVVVYVRGRLSLSR